ncbi:unnamed protein product [Dibothriocephalus latus]|uniref:Uncharacterized protein n=1 Tax=Dibothriocephalus latus TaxID=60516 RepID=A0A3P7LUX5_DIBLA|nr:unnamed protein product [Dibothriocephalus latus]
MKASPHCIHILSWLLFVCIPFVLSSRSRSQCTKQVDSDGDLKLDEAEYCLPASLAEKVASAGGLEVNGMTHGLKKEALESAILRPFENSSLPDESRDLLLSTASTNLLTPNVSGQFLCTFRPRIPPLRTKNKFC